MYLLYLRWPDSFFEILALCSTKEKVDEFRTQALEKNSVLEDYIKIIEVEPDKLYAWHELERVI